MAHKKTTGEGTTRSEQGPSWEASREDMSRALVQTRIRRTTGAASAKSPI